MTYTVEVFLADGAMTVERIPGVHRIQLGSGVVSFHGDWVHVGSKHYEPCLWSYSLAHVVKYRRVDTPSPAAMAKTLAVAG